MRAESWGPGRSRRTAARRTLIIAGSIIALGASSGCGSEEEPTAEDRPSEPAQTSQAPATDPPATEDRADEPARTAPPPAAPESTVGDRTDELLAAGEGESWARDVVQVRETEPGRIEIETTLVDPRGENGSPEARVALAICRAAVDTLDAAKTVNVIEEDGTTFVLYGHPAYPDGCTEI